jgi:hypothetical protein
MNRDWAVPVALGLLVATGLWVASPDGPGTGTSEGGTPGTTTHPASTLLLTPFTTSWGASGTNATFLVVAPKGQQAAEEGLNATGLAWASPRLDWTGGNPAKGVEHRLAFYSIGHSAGGCVGGNATVCVPDGWPLPLANATHDAAPRFGMAGYNATRATIYVFDSRGLLAATNDAPGNWSRFGGAPTTLDSALWYLGANATAPNGTEAVPSFAEALLPQLRPVLQGLEVGGVASARSNAYAGFGLGTLFITARIDELAYAP